MFGGKNSKSKNDHVTVQVDDGVPRTIRGVFNGVDPVGLSVIPYETPAIYGESEVVDGEIVSIEPSKGKTKGLKPGKLSKEVKAARRAIAKVARANRRRSCTGRPMENNTVRLETYIKAYPGDPVRASAEWNNSIGNINGVSPYYCGE